MSDSPTPLEQAASDRRHVLLRLSAEVGFDRGVTRGVVRFANLEHRWRLYGQPAYAVDRVPGLRHWRGDGVIGRITRSDEPLPGGQVVNVSNMDPPPHVPLVTNDDRAIGRVAGEYLMRLGLNHFAFLADERYRYCRERLDGFIEALRDSGKGGGVSVLNFDSTMADVEQRPQLAAAVSDLTRPVGILALNDTYAWRVLEAARDAGVAVPEEAAVLGVDNDTFLCEMADPPLSSVQVPLEAIGHEAAKLLAGLMAGQAPPPRPMRIPPIGVVTRRSTDMVAVTDPLVARALHFIRSQAPARLELAAVFAAVPASRRALERRFRAALGRTVWQELHRHRLEHARRLLAETTFPLDKVADLSGFSDAKQLGAAFHRDLGTSPTAYRRRFQSRDSLGRED